MNKFEVLVIGGSAGSLPVLSKILREVSATLNIPTIIIMHRMKNVPSEMDKLLSFHTQGKKVIEPDDKEPIRPDSIYLAPQNYHLLIEADKSFSLDYSEVVQYSRPSIDVTFESVSNVYGEGVLAILLSGANSDGTKGIIKVIERKGTVIVQEPTTAEYPFMPQNVIDLNLPVNILPPDAITNYLHNLNK